MVGMNGKCHYPSKNNHIMKKRILSVIIAATFLTIASITTAQAQADTISVLRNRFLYQEHKINKPAMLRDILLKEPAAPQVNIQWKQYQTFHGIGLGIEIGGVGLMGYGLVKSLSGKESGTTMIAGAGIMLAGVLVDRFVAFPRLKSAVRSYNDQQMGRKQPEVFPWPSEMPMQSDTLQHVAPEPGAYPEKAVQSSHPSGKYFGLSMGSGWSRQKINFAFAFNEKVQSASVFSFGIQYGDSFSQKMGWQAELALAQHGFRMKKTSTSGGVKIYSKADFRARNLEIPICLTYKTPVGKSKIEAMATPGIVLGYTVSEKIVSQGTGENETRKVWTKTVDQISLEDVKFGDRLDIGLLVGAQTAYPAGPGKVFLEARYHLGLLNLERNKEFQYTEDGDKVFNRTMALRIGYRYSL